VGAPAWVLICGCPMLSLFFPTSDADMCLLNKWSCTLILYSRNCMSWHTKMTTYFDGTPSIDSLLRQFSRSHVPRTAHIIMRCTCGAHARCGSEGFGGRGSRGGAGRTGGGGRANWSSCGGGGATFIVPDSSPDLSTTPCCIAQRVVLSLVEVARCCHLFQTWEHRNMILW
jgi:uncharacterized membrane protein YgcG